MADQPIQRKKNITGTGKEVARRGAGTGSGPVGQGSAFSNRSGGNRQGGYDGGQRGSFGNGKGKLFLIIIAVLVLLLGGGKGFGDLLGGSDPGDVGTGTSFYSSASSQSNGSSTVDISSILGSYQGGNSVSNVSGGWIWKDNTGKLNESVDSSARAKYVSLKGNGQDTVTIMVYMCGTDLESKSGMASNDLREMMKATLTNKVNIIVYTGGCKDWKLKNSNKENVISNNRNQIFKVESGGLSLLEQDMGSGSMTDPKNLTTFINYCSKNYKADRNMLIFWDHGGGSLSGYGYDEKNPQSGSMNLAGINTALSDAGIKFDFIGFDACLMATLETDLMAAEYADYLIASEETEPGVGWYYTDWLTELSANTSMPTIEIGKRIADDFVEECYRVCGNQKTTLSVVDLAELSSTISDDLKKFSQSTTELIKDGSYKTVSDARSNTREFSSNKIDQIDLYSFARNIGTAESEELAATILNAVKYNRTSSNMPNAYGISIYFPYRKTGKVNSAIQTYNAIGLDSSYSACIKEFAGLELSGQAATGGSNVTPVTQLTGSSSGATNPSSIQSLDSIFSLIDAFTGGTNSDMLSSLTSIMVGRTMTDRESAEYINDHQFDAGSLNWVKGDDGFWRVRMSSDQWQMVHSVDLNVFIDDGTGYIDMGLDNSCSFDKEGNLLADGEGTWLAVNAQPVAYYHTDTVTAGSSYTISGYIPALLNGERVKLMVVFTDEDPYGRIEGAAPDYGEEVTETQARGLTELKEGDTLDFLADYYTYSGVYRDSYMIGDRITVGDSGADGLIISDVYLSNSYIALYKFTDIYNQSYWTNAVPKE